MSSHASHPPLSLLVVDDESVVQQLVASLFDDAGAQVLLASNATQALLLAQRKGPIEVALVDKNLPDRSGLEVAAELKGIDPDIEIVLITGYASLESAISAIHLDVFDYVVKPFDHIDLLKRKILSASEKGRLKRERRRMLAQMTTTIESFQALLDSSRDAVIVFDVHQQVVQDVNESAIVLYGYQREELIGLPVRELRKRAADGAWTGRDRSGAEFPLEVTQTTFERLGRVIETASPLPKL